MSAVPMLAGIGLMMVCCSSSSVASMMMSGNSGDDDTGNDNFGGGGSSNTPPPRAKYEIYPDYDFTGGDIGCHQNTEATACEAKCDADDRCVSYIHTAGDKLCCIKHGTPNYTNLPSRQITGYIKNIDGYEVKEVGDRPSGDIENMNPGTLPTCKARCDELDNCIGFNFKNNNCWIKKVEGIANEYTVNGYQFYTKM